MFVPWPCVRLTPTRCVLLGVSAASDLPRMGPSLQTMRNSWNIMIHYGTILNNFLTSVTRSSQQARLCRCSHNYATSQ